MEVISLFPYQPEKEEFNELNFELLRKADFNICINFL